MTGMSYAGIRDDLKTDMECSDGVLSESTDIMSKMADGLGVSVDDLSRHFAVSSDVEDEDGESDAGSMRSLGTDVGAEKGGGNHAGDGMADGGEDDAIGDEEVGSEYQSNGGDVQDAGEEGAAESDGDNLAARGMRFDGGGANLQDVGGKSNALEDPGNAKMDADERVEDGAFVDSVSVTLEGACGSSCVAGAELLMLRERVDHLEAAMTVVVAKLDSLGGNTTSREIVTADQFESYVDSALESGHSLGVSRPLIRAYLQMHHGIEPTRYTKARLNKILKKKVESKEVIFENDLFRLVARE